MKNNSKIFAHRGYSAKFPENTMLAFKKAADYQADGIELDVHLTKDHQLVICHDETIDRTSNGSGTIKEMTLKELKNYRFNNNFEYLDGTVDEIGIPTLEEVIRWIVTTPLLLNIEIKNNVFSYDGIADRIIELIDVYQCADQVIISSFNHYTIRQVKEIRPDIKCAFLTFSNILNIADYCSFNKVEYYHPAYRTLRSNEIEELHDAGIGINPYTLNKAEEIEQALQDNLNYIITNEVELAVQLNNRKKLIMV